MSRLLVYYDDGHITVYPEPREIVLYDNHVELRTAGDPVGTTLARFFIVKLEVRP